MINAELDGRIVIFCFAGRRKYLEIQKQYIFEILNRYSNVEYHLWNFCRNSDDDKYVRALAEQHSQIKIFNQFYEGDNKNTKCIKAVGIICTCTKCRVGKWTEPYKEYSKSDEYRSATFVKVDDDVLFIDTKRFGKLVNAIRTSPHLITSAFVINNGLCAQSNEQYRKLVIESGSLKYGMSKPRGGRLRYLITSFQRFLGYTPTNKDWWYLCTKVDFFNLSHEYFLDRSNEILSQDSKLLPLPQSRFSINAIGFNWDVVSKISGMFGELESMNDEELISNNFKIQVENSVVCSHFHFADQRAQITDADEDLLLERYMEFSKSYLAKS